MMILLNEFMDDGCIYDDRKNLVCRDNIYAGCVIKYDEKKHIETIQRKILFKIDGDKIEDLLFDSPAYSNNQFEKYYVSFILKLEKMLDELDEFKYWLYSEDIKRIYKFFLSKNAVYLNSKIIKDLPISQEEYLKLKFISDQRKYPTKSEKKDFKKFKTKIKTYTFK